VIEIFYRTSGNRCLSTTDVYAAVEKARCEYYGICMGSTRDVGKEQSLWAVGKNLPDALMAMKSYKYSMKDVLDWFYYDDDFEWIAAPMKKKTFIHGSYCSSHSFCTVLLSKSGILYFRKHWNLDRLKC